MTLLVFYPSLRSIDITCGEMCTDNSRIDLKQFGAYGMLVVVVIRYLTCFVPSGGGLGAREHHPSYEGLCRNI